jgi:glycosyltransferase involved in cell wall biosynthesis
MGRPLRIWMPTIRSGSGADIFTERLADGLRCAGHEPIVQWLDLRYEIAPWLLKKLDMPAGTDIIHTGCIPGFALRRKGVPLVVTEHQYLRNPAFLPYSTGLRRLYQRMLIHRYMARTYALADRIVAVSHHCADAMRRDLHRSIDVIHNWVDLDAFSPISIARNEHPFRLLFVGNPSPWKGSDILVPLARRLGADFTIEAMGGIRKAFVADAFAPSNLQAAPSRVTGDMPGAYAAADAVLVVSRYESFGYVALEAMASGRPVVGFNAPGTSEVCINDSTALLVPVDDVDALARACRRLAGDRALAARLGAAGRERAATAFAERDAIERYVSVYKEAKTELGKSSLARH